MPLVKLKRYLKRVRKDESGDTLAFLLLFPTFFIAAFLLLLHVFLVNQARAELEIAASRGIRAAWDISAEAKTNPDIDDIDFAMGDDVIEEALKQREDAAMCAALAHMGPLGDFSEIDYPGGLAGGCVTWADERSLIDHDPDWLSVLNPRVSAVTDMVTGELKLIVEGTVAGPLAAWWPSVIGRVSVEVCGPLPVMNTSQVDVTSACT